MNVKAKKKTWYSPVIVLMMGIAMILLNSYPSFAQVGGHNGGDTLEREFRNISSDIQSWILNGGAQALRLPDGITLAMYQGKMLEALSFYNVSFTNDTIVVNHAEKQCENSPATKIIRCNIDRFKGASEAEKYVIVHHEYAGIAGLEENNGSPASKYFISDQITGSLEKETKLKLTVKKKPLVVGSSQCTFLLVGYKKHSIDNYDIQGYSNFLTPRAKQILVEKQYLLTKRKSQATVLIEVDARIREGSLYSRLTMKHALTGFTRRVESYSKLITRFPKDPYNVAIEEKMLHASNAVEYEKLKNQLNPALNREPVENDVGEIIFKDIPTCEEFLGIVQAQ